MEYPFRIRTRVQWGDTDVSGRIHFAAIFKYLEEADHELWRASGVTYRELQDEVHMPRVNVSCDYRAAMVYDDQIEIVTTITRLGRTSVTYRFDVLRDGELMAEAAMTLVCVSVATGRPVPIPERFAEVVRPLIERHNASH
ncbi:MAG: acyl-CoA thioesterase [Chloroflexi bacterium]|nr:acyl-CoA thioesterase [Chloroflexota bacterium]